MKLKLCLPSWIVITVVNFSCVSSSGAKSCESFGDCVLFSGYTCKNSKCVCDPQEPGFFRCTPPKFYGERCTSDQECQLGDYNLQCLKSEIRMCKCKRGFVWDMERKKCLPTLDGDMYSGKFEPVRDLVIPGLIVMTIGAMVYLGFKLFCNCGKLWRRRRHQDITRELGEMSANPHQQAWIASYRVFNPYSTPNRPSSVLSPPSFPLHHPACMGLFVPSQSLLQSPPPYEEALKHKVILSNYHNAVPGVPRQYQSLPANASACSGDLLHPGGEANGSTLKCGGHRSFSGAQSDFCVANDWGQNQSIGTPGDDRNPHAITAPQNIPITSHPADPTDHQPRAPPMELWTSRPRNSQLFMSQTRGGAYRPGHPQKIYHGSDSPKSSRTNDRNTQSGGANISATGLSRGLDTEGR